jgi:hypothetical protein
VPKADEHDGRVQALADLKQERELVERALKRSAPCASRAANAARAGLPKWMAETAR